MYNNHVEAENTFTFNILFARAVNNIAGRIIIENKDAHLKHIENTEKYLNAKNVKYEINLIKLDKTYHIDYRRVNIKQYTGVKFIIEK